MNYFLQFIFSTDKGMGILVGEELMLYNNYKNGRMHFFSSPAVVFLICRKIFGLQRLATVKNTTQGEKLPLFATVLLPEIRFLKENDADSKKVFIFEALINMDTVFSCINPAY